MTFKTDDNGIITSATSGTECIGSQILETKPVITDFVLINRPKGDRAPKYGIYGGQFRQGEAAEKCVIRTILGDELVNVDAVKAIIPGERLLEHAKKCVQTACNCNSYPKWVKFYVALFEWKYPEIYTSLTIPHCDKCGAAFPEHFYRGKNICSNCYREYFITCESCGEMVERSESEDGECLHCYQRHRVLPYHRHAPRIRFHGDTRGNTEPYMGIELEVAFGGERDDNVAEILPLINQPHDCFMYCSHDSSIEDGFENITNPATLEYHESLYSNYKSVFKRLRELDYLSHDSDCCGMHVHFNRSFYDGSNEEECIAKLCFLFEKFWGEISVFSRRNKVRLNRFSRKIDMRISEYIRRSNKSHNHDFHYYSINLANEETIEIRMFRGTLNIETFFATLELVRNLAVFSKVKTNAELQEMTWDDILTTDRLKSYWERVTHINREQ